MSLTKTLLLGPLLIAMSPLPLAAAEFGISTSTYLGDASDGDSTRGLKIAADGTVVAAVNMGAADPGSGGTTRTYLNGATAGTPGAIVRFSADGRTVLSITRLAGALYDMAMDAAGNLYVAAGADGMFKLNPTATTVVWQHLAGSFVYRCDAGPAGGAVALVPGNPGALEGSSGPGMIHYIDTGGVQQAAFAGRHNTQDVTIDETGASIIFIGFSVPSSYGPPGDSSWNPVHIPYLRAVDFAGTLKWSDYDWSPKTGYDAATDSYVSDANDPIPAGTAQSKIDPRYLNRLTNNMADTRGYRCSMGADGMLYAGFEAAGGNTVMNHSPVDLGVAAPVAAGDFYNSFANTGASHKTFAGRFNPATGALVLGQRFVTVVAGSGGAPSANTFRISGGDIQADASGRLYLGGECAYGLPMYPSQWFTPSPARETFNPFGSGAYLGGAYFMVMSADLTTRLYTTRLATGGITHAVAARTVEGSNRIAFGGYARLSSGPIHTQDALQTNPGYGAQDATLAVLGGTTGGATAVRAKFTWGYANYGSGTFRDGAPAETVLDLDGDGFDDSRQLYAFSDTVAFSPSLPYSGPAMYGGFENQTLNALTKTFSDRGVMGNTGNSTTAIRIEPIVGVSTRQHGLIYFKKDSISGPAPADKLSFDRGSLLFCDAGQGRWVVRERGIHYVSEASLATSSGLSFETDTDDGRWAVWDPQAGLDFDAAAAVWINRDFDDIDAFGLMVDQDTWLPGRFWWKWTLFSADFAVNHVDDTAPDAMIAATPTAGPHPLNVNFDGTASTDPLGPINFYSWNFGNGTTGSGPNPAGVYAAAGPYTASLTVWDALTQTDSASQPVYVTSSLGGTPALTVAAFGGTMGTASFARDQTYTQMDLDGDWDFDDAWRLSAFSTTTPLLGSIKGTRWFGGAQSHDFNAASTWAERGSTGSAFGWRIQPAASAPVSMSGVFYIDKADFLNGGATRAVALETGATLKMGGITRWEQVGTVRWVIRNGADFFISESALAPAGGLATLTISAAERWSALDPSLLEFDSGAATFETREFNDVTGVGFQVNSPTPSTTRHWLVFGAFEVVGSITPPGPAPVAVIQTSHAQRDINQTVTFNGSASTGEGLSYRWSFGDGSTATGAAIPYAYTLTGIYPVSLTVTDSGGRTATATLAYPVVSNPAPVAAFTTSATGGEVPLTVNFDAAGSSDDAGIVSYEWDFDGNGTWDATGVTASFTYTTPNLWAPKLRVTDAGEKQTTATAAISATSGGKIPPVASFYYTPDGSSMVPVTKSFNATASHDPNGTIASYQWDFQNDGIIDATGSSVSHMFTQAGAIEVRLVVTDNEGATGTRIQTLGFTADPSSTPLVYWRGEMVTADRNFGGTKVTNSGLDLDGDGAGDDARGNWAFSATTPLSPASNYTGVPFYGGLRFDKTNSTSSGPDEVKIANATSTDKMSIRYQGGSSNATRGWMTMFWDKANFLNGGSTQPVSFRIGGRIRVAGDGFENLGQMRWLVRDGAQYWVSQALVAPVFSGTYGTATLSFTSDFSDGNWAAYDPAAELNFNQAGADFSDRNFTNVTAVGFIVDGDDLLGLRRWLKVDFFEMAGTLNDTSVSPFAAWIANPEFGLSGDDALPGADPDHDGANNLMEFATNGNPSSGASGARTRSKMHPLWSGDALCFSIAVRKGGASPAPWTASGSRQQTQRDGVTYVVEASNDLTTWNTVVVDKLSGFDAEAVEAAYDPPLPALDADWEWATFATDGGAQTDPGDFIRLRVGN